MRTGFIHNQQWTSKIIFLWVFFSLVSLFVFKRMHELSDQLVAGIKPLKTNRRYRSAFSCVCLCQCVPLCLVHQSQGLGLEWARMTRNQCRRLHFLKPSITLLPAQKLLTSALLCSHYHSSISPAPWRELWSSFPWASTIHFLISLGISSLLFIWYTHMYPLYSSTNDTMNLWPVSRWVFTDTLLSGSLCKGSCPCFTVLNSCHCVTWSSIIFHFTLQLTYRTSLIPWSVHLEQSYSQSNVRTWFQYLVI